MPDRARIGLINTSWYAESMHLPSLKSHPGAEVVAICGRRRERAEELAAKFEIPQAYTDYRAMIDQAGLDGIIVAAPDDQHFAMTMDALDAGLHVLCEKPLAYTLDQARQMTAKAEQAGVKHMVFFTLRWLPHTRALRELLDAGYIGRSLHGHFNYLAGGARSGEYRWRFDADRANGILGDLGSHLIDTAIWYFGDVRRVSAHLATHLVRPDAEGRPAHPANDSAMLTLEFAGGAQAQMHLSAVTYLGERVLEQQIALHGAGGTLETGFTFGNFGGSGVQMSVAGIRAGESRRHPLAVPDHIWGDVDRGNPLDVLNKQPAGDRLFVDAILNDAPVTPTFHDGLRVQEVIEAAKRADSEQRWVRIDEL